MPEPPDGPPAARPDTPEAAAAQTQTRTGEDGGTAAGGGTGALFCVGARVTQAVHTHPYERDPEEPLYRPLRIYTLDPSVSRFDGAEALVNVPYEPLAPGPVGTLLAIDPRDGALGVTYRRADLDDPSVLIRDGYAPSPTEPRFHQQMVYAVGSLVYAAFRKALGRDLGWGFAGGEQPCRLRIQPHAFRGANAYYDGEAGALRFGYFQASKDAAQEHVPGEFVFTALSHDVIAHEMAHALLDGLRARFTLPTGPDVLAFHEAFADLVALFQHFSYPTVVERALAEAGGRLAEADLLTDLARQFGHTTHGRGPLRTAVDVTAEGARPKTCDDVGDAPHERGAVLVSAVFEAFATVYRRKTARYLRLATGGTGRLPEGELPGTLRRILADEAGKLAGQFLSICIRAVDYCPPVDLTFGEYLRAVITADLDLVPDDPWGYREAWIDAFRRRRITPRGVPTLSEDALRWRPPDVAVEPAGDLAFQKLSFEGEPGRPSGADELVRQAEALGRLVSDPRHRYAFGLAAPGDGTEAACVESIRTSRRVGPDGQLAFDLVAEVTQRRRVEHDGRSFAFYGGSTVILDPYGHVRFSIAKQVQSAHRLAAQRAFVAGQGARYWQAKDGVLRPARHPFKLVHGAEEGG